MDGQNKVSVDRLEELLNSNPECKLHSTLRAYPYKTLSEHSALSYGDFKEETPGIDITHDNFDHLLITLPLCGGSDYSGGTLHRANYQDFKTLLGETPALKELYGGYNSYGLILGVSELAQIDDPVYFELLETLEGLTDYPLINDETMYEIERELFEEYVTDDWPRELARETGIEVSDDLALAIFWQVYEELDYPEVTYETGCIVYFEFDQILEVIKENMINPAIEHHKDQQDREGLSLTDLDLIRILSILDRPEEYIRDNNYDLIDLITRLIKKNTILA